MLWENTEVQLMGSKLPSKELLQNWISIYLPFTYVNIVAKSLKDCKNVLDVGCGRGDFMIELKRKKRIGEILYSVGIERYLPYINEAKKKMTHDDYILADVRYLPIKSKSFEGVLCSQVLEHIEKHEGLMLINDFENLALKKVVIGTPHGFHAPSDPDAQINHLQEHRSSYKHHLFSSIGYVVRGQGLELVWGDSGLIKKLPWCLKPLVVMISYFSGPLIYFIPSISANIICVKEVNTRG